LKTSKQHSDIKIIKSSLIVTKEYALSSQLKKTLSAADYAVIAVDSLLQSVVEIIDNQIDVYIADIDYIDQTSLKFIHIISSIRPRLPIIIITSDNSIDSNRQLFKNGVYYIELKPINESNLSNVFKKMHQLPARTHVNK